VLCVLFFDYSHFIIIIIIILNNIIISLVFCAVDDERLATIFCIIPTSS